MDAAMTQLAKALASSKAAGSETIEGTLLDEDTGKPIPEAQVMMGCKSVVKNAVSDANGHFVLTGIPVEECDFSVMQSNITWENAQHKRSEEHTSELQSLMRISYAVFCLKKKKK